ncbi:hypothetical protein D3C77_777490 [compost metagenome]
MPLLQAGAEGLRQSHQYHVEVELIQALLVLGTIHGTQTDLHAEAGQVFTVGLENSLQARIDQQELEA